MKKRFLWFLIAGVFANAVYSQRLGVIEPERDGAVAYFAERLSAKLAAEFRLVDDGIVSSAAASLKIENYFNLKLSESKRIGSVIGCDYFLLVRSNVQRRISIEKADYFEAYAVIYLVSSRSGRLVFWTLKNAEANEPQAAAEKLLESVPISAAEIAAKVRGEKQSDIGNISSNPIEELPVENSPAAKNLKPPVPYRRIKPEYTRTAYLYSVRATVDIEADIGADGSILQTRIVRWAGYGLDESVTNAIRKMNWRPAERNGKNLPMRVLLRYNFVKIEPEDEL